MSILEALLLGFVEGLTEFLPISSTGHLTILESALGYSVDDPDITAFTAIIQVGAVFATLLYFRGDFLRIGRAWIAGMTGRGERGFDYQFGWSVIIGSIPIGIVGLTFKDEIETTLRSLYVVGGALILWSGVMWFADRTATQERGERDVTWRDALIIGLAQCLALIPGVSRSGATLSAGLLRGFDRVTVTRMSFFLSIPALTAAAILQTITKFDDISNGVGWTATLTATVTSFVVAYAAVAWLLRYIAKHDYSIFIIYRLVLGSLVLTLVSTGVLAAT